MPNLLPDDFGTESVQPPVVLLREQADHLGRRTGELVLAGVRSHTTPGQHFGGFGVSGPSGPGGGFMGSAIEGTSGPNGPQARIDQQNFIHRFVLEVPTLDNYNFDLFTVVHPLLFYPLWIDFPYASGALTVQNANEFEEALRKIFAHAEVKRVVAALKAQAAAATEPAKA